MHFRRGHTISFVALSWDVFARIASGRNRKCSARSVSLWYDHRRQRNPKFQGWHGTVYRPAGRSPCRCGCAKFRPLSSQPRWQAGNAEQHWLIAFRLSKPCDRRKHRRRLYAQLMYVHNGFLALVESRLAGSVRREQGGRVESSRLLFRSAGWHRGCRGRSAMRDGGPCDPREYGRVQPRAPRSFRHRA